MATVEGLINQLVIDHDVFRSRASHKRTALLYWNESVNGLKLSDITMSYVKSFGTSALNVDMELSNLDGGGRLYSVDIEFTITSTFSTRQSDSGTLTLTIAANAVDETNSETTIDIECLFIGNYSGSSDYSLSDTDFELVNATPDLPLVQESISFPNAGRIMKDGDHFYYGASGAMLESYDIQGNRDSSRDITFSGVAGGADSIIFMGDYIFIVTVWPNFTRRLHVIDRETGVSLYRIDGLGNTCSQIPGGRFLFLRTQTIYSSPVDFDRIFEADPDSGTKRAQDLLDSEDLNITFNEAQPTFGGADRTFINNNLIIYRTGEYFYIMNYDYEVLDSMIYPSFGCRIVGLDDNYIWARLSSGLYRVPINKITPPKRRQLIYPIFAREGDTIDMTKYVSGADTIVWDKNYDPPSYLTLSGTGVTISNNAVTEETSVEVKLKAINKRGFTDDNNFKLYITILKDRAPVVEDVDNISMEPNSTFDIAQLVDDADTFTSLQLPSGASFAGNTLTVGTESGQVRIRATKGTLTSDIEFNVDVVIAPSADDYSDIFRYALEIAGIDVTDDLEQEPYPEISNTLDPVNVNEYIVNNATLKLDYRNGYYNYDMPNNFWIENNLNPNGYLEPIKLFVESYVNGSWIRRLLFVGLINETVESIDDDTIILNCVDISYQLKNIQYKGRGLEKYARSFRSQRVSYEGIYDFEEFVLPISEGSAEAWAGKDKLGITTTRNPSEGVNIDNNAYVSRSQILTKGGRLDSVPFLKYKTPYRSKDTTFAIDELSKAGRIFNPDNKIFKPELSKDVIQNKGNIAFNVQNTRITHIPQDWIDIGDKVYILLTNPTIGYKDILVEHDIPSDSQRIIKEFDDDITCLQLASADGDTFYVMTTESIELDRSLFPVPVDSEEVIKKYDTSRGADTKILQYVKSTNATTDFVDSSDSQRPQVGMHYYVGFSNDLRNFDFEGIVPENRASFRVYSNNLYYRYWRSEGFGVARVASNGTITELTRRTNISRNNHMNFDFDIDSSGNTYMAYIESASANSTFKVRQITSAGSESELFSDTKTITELTDASDEGGSWSGVYEVKEHNGDLYIIAAITPNETYYAPTDVETKIRSTRKGAGGVLYKLDISNVAAGLEVIETYDFIQSSIRSLTVHNGQIYYIESPSVSYKFQNFNPDITESFSIGLDRNLNQDLGKLKRLSSSGEVEDLGNLWYTTFPYRSTNMPMLSIDNELHCIMSFGKTDDVLRTRIQASRNDNFQWIKYGKKIEYVLNQIPSGNVYNVIVDIAKKTNALFSLKLNRITLIDKDPYLAKLNASLNDSATTLAYDGDIKPIPSSGYALIDSEIIKYTGKSNTQLTGITRGAGKTNIVSHNNNADLLYLDNIIVDDSYLSSSLRLDTNRFFNVIQESNLILEKRDEQSIRQYLEKVYSLDLGLSRHDAAWIEYMYDKYLLDLKELRFFVNVSLKPSFYISIGDIVSFYYAGRILKPFRVTSIDYDRKSTEIQGRTV